MNSIPSNLEYKAFSYQEALSSGLSLHYIQELLKKGELTRLERGVYVCSSYYDNETIYQAATKVSGEDSIICLLSALEYYDLTDEIPKKVSIMVPASKRVSSDSVETYRKKDLYPNIGVIQEDGYKITSIERTIVECLVHKKRLGGYVAVEALKRAVENKKVKVSDLYQMAKQLKKSHVVEPYLEMLI